MKKRKEVLVVLVVVAVAGLLVVIFLPCGNEVIIEDNDGHYNVYYNVEIVVVSLSLY